MTSRSPFAIHFFYSMHWVWRTKIEIVIEKKIFPKNSQIESKRWRVNAWIIEQIDKVEERQGETEFEKKRDKR